VESEDVRLVASEGLLESEKTKGVSWRGLVKLDGVARCLLEAACLVTTKDGNPQKTKTQELLDVQVELLSDEQESRGKEGGLLEVYALE